MRKVTIKIALSVMFLAILLSTVSYFVLTNLHIILLALALAGLALYLASKL